MYIPTLPDLRPAVKSGAAMTMPEIATHPFETDFTRHLNDICAEGDWSMDVLNGNTYGPASPRYIPLRFPSMRDGVEVWHGYKAHRCRLGGETLYLFRDQVRPGHCRRVLVTASGCIYMEDEGKAVPLSQDDTHHKYVVAVREIHRADISIAGNIRRNEPGSTEQLPYREPIALPAELRAYIDSIINYRPFAGMAAPLGGDTGRSEDWNR